MSEQLFNGSLQPFPLVRPTQEPHSPPFPISKMGASPLRINPAHVVARAVFSQIAVFGDSLSDSGNAWNLWHHETAPPYDTLDALSVPTYPYAIDHHYCNGPSWIELFAKTLGLELNSRPAYSGQIREHMNFAVGRARARNVREDDLINLSAQVTEFLRRTQGAELKDTLCAIEIGCNDVRDALGAPPEGNGSSQILTEALDEIDTSIRKLYEKGARKFLVWTLPDIGKTPAVRFLDTVRPGMAQRVGELTAAFNAGLKTHIKALSELQGVTIVELDVHKKFDQMVSSPQEYQLSDVTTPYIKRDVSASEHQNPDEYLFWDGIHPTEVFHRVISQEAAVVMSQGSR